MVAIKRLRVLRVHHLLILLASQAYFYGGLSNPCFIRVLRDEKNSLGLLAHFGNLGEFVGRKEL